MGPILVWIKSFLARWIIRIAIFFIDKAIAGAINGIMDEGTMGKIGNRVDNIVDKIQTSGTETGKAVRAKSITLCEVIIKKLKEANGIS